MLPWKRQLQEITKQKLYDYICKELNSYCNVNTDDAELLDESQPGKKFYDSLISRGYKKDELFKIIIPIEILTNRAAKMRRVTEIATEVPIDTDTIRAYAQEYEKAMQENTELFSKYKKMADWYTDFHKLVFESLPESDANLFIAACAFASANTAVDVNIVEASKLYKTVKNDFAKSNASRKALAIIAKTINSVDNKNNVRMLEKLAQLNCSYAQLLIPKRDTTDPKQKQVREITVSQAKLTNYNQFVLYFLSNNGKITKGQIMADIQSGTLSVGGTKIFSFFINLIDPEFTWETEGSVKIQPATIDRWMVRIFFERPLRSLLDELVKDDIVIDNKKSHMVFIMDAIMKLFNSDVVRSNIVKILNEEVYNSKSFAQAHRLQAFAWVKYRQDRAVKADKFASFEDVVNFAAELSEKIDEINPELNFINSTGKKIESQTEKVITTINLFANLPRMNFKDEEETERIMKGWLKFQKEFELDTTAKDKMEKAKSQAFKYTIQLKKTREGQYTADVTQKGARLHSIAGDTRTIAIKAAKNWINVHRPMQ